MRWEDGLHFFPLFLGPQFSWALTLFFRLLRPASDICKVWDCLALVLYLVALRPCSRDQMNEWWIDSSVLEGNGGDGEWSAINSAQAEKLLSKNSAIFVCSSAISIPYILFFFLLLDKKRFKKTILITFKPWGRWLLPTENSGSFTPSVSFFIATPEQ